MKKYYPGGSLADINNVYGYSVAQTLVAVLKASGNNLTRENIMKQAASIHDLKLPMLLPGITISTSATDFAPIKQMQLMKFDGETWKLFGEVIRVRQLRRLAAAAGGHGPPHTARPASPSAPRGRARAHRRRRARARQQA